MESSRLTQEDIESLKEDLRELGELRIFRKELFNIYLKKKQEFTEQTKNLAERLESVEERLNRAKATIYTKALKIYNRNPEEGKDIYGGIKERDFTEVLYDEHEAYKWCENHSLFLIVNRSAFEKCMRRLDRMNVPTFVNRVTTPTITLPTNIKDLEDV